MLQDLYVYPSPSFFYASLRTTYDGGNNAYYETDRDDSVNKDIVVRLKWGETEYHGRLVSSDSYMNIQLTNAQEFIEQKFTSDLGQILIRCVPALPLVPYSTMLSVGLTEL